MNDKEQRFSYIRRSGRMTKGQTRGYEEIRNHYHTDPRTFSQQPGPLGVEIGFGMGQGLVAWAEESPAWTLLGIELYRPGVGALAKQISERNISNVMIIEQPAQEVFAGFAQAGASAFLAEVRIYFPDPWPKKRHAKRRLIQADFIASVAHALQPGGKLKIATDWDPYAAWIREVMSQQDLLRCEVDQIDGDALRAQATKFEARGKNLGHEIHDLIYVRGTNSATTESR
ncbi:MAG: tRNA (guanosine(46)-N7)-methyltransferase TrmB [Pseudomonadales bacterium]